MVKSAYLKLFFTYKYISIVSGQYVLTETVQKRCFENGYIITKYYM